MRDEKYWNNILHPGNPHDLTFTNESIPFLEAMLRTGKIPDHLVVEHYLLCAQSERELMNRVIVAGMLIRAGMRVKYSLNELNEAYAWAQRVRDVFDLPSADARDPVIIREQLSIIVRETSDAPESLMKFLCDRSLVLMVDPVFAGDINLLSDEWGIMWDQEIRNLQIFRDRIFPRLLRMQKEIKEIAAFNGHRVFSYCSADELQVRLREVRTKKRFLTEEALLAKIGDSPIMDPNLSREIAPFWFVS